MIRRSKPRLIAAVVAAACFGAACSSPALTSFVSRVTTERNPDFVTPAERIAVFDNDGTLWAEQPMYFQLAFALDRVRALAPQHPEWTAQEPFKSVLASDLTGVIAGGEHALLGIVDKAGKPVGIQQVIGRRPTIAFGNSDGDFEML